MSNGAAQASAGATYRMLRELGKRAQRSYAAIREPNELFVVQRFVRAGGGGVETHDDLDVTAGMTPLDAEAMALMLRDARCLAKNWHPNVARVRHVDLAPSPRSMLTLASDFVDGATLEDLVAAAAPLRTSADEPPLALPILARILIDVLAGLHAVHVLRDGMNAPLGAFHGELCPTNVVVGKDGVARIVNVLRKRPVRVRYGSEAVGYAAPEALDAQGSDEPRSDVYAVGVMLWEGLAGRRLTTEPAPGRILVRQREGELARPEIDPSSPLAGLADVALRALSFDPSLRYRGTAEMAADIRRIAGTNLATGAAVATCVAELAGERIRMRRAVLEPAVSGTRRRASERSVIAAAEELRETAVHRAITAEQIAIAKGLDPGSAVSVPSLPPLPPPVTPRFARPNVRRIVSQPRRAEQPPPPDEPADDVEAGIAEAEHLIVAALASTTAKMRAVAIERAATPTPPEAVTPGAPCDVVIPIHVSETWNEPAPPPPRRRFAVVAFVAGLALVAVIAIGAFLAFGGRVGSRGANVAPAPTIASTAFSAGVLPSSPPAASPAEEAAPPIAPSSATPPPAARAPAPATPLPSPPKPKKSIYDPDGL